MSSPNYSLNFYCTLLQNLSAHFNVFSFEFSKLSHPFLTYSLIKDMDTAGTYMYTSIRRILYYTHYDVWMFRIKPCHPSVVCLKRTDVNFLSELYGIGEIIIILYLIETNNDTIKDLKFSKSSRVEFNDLGTLPTLMHHAPRYICVSY